MEIVMQWKLPWAEPSPGLEIQLCFLGLIVWNIMISCHYQHSSSNSFLAIQTKRQTAWDRGSWRFKTVSCDKAGQAASPHRNIWSTANHTCSVTSPCVALPTAWRKRALFPGMSWNWAKKLDENKAYQYWIYIHPSVLNNFQGLLLMYCSTNVARCAQWLREVL